MTPGKRATRVGDQILREMALLLLEKVQDPRIRGVTLTGIRLSNDLRQAKVFYSVLGAEGAVEEALKGLNSAKGFIKREIGIRMALRYVPELCFAYDPSLEVGSHLERIFEAMGSLEKGLP